MSSLTSSGAVVSVPVSASSSSPPSSGGARIQQLVALSVRPARSHCPPADTLGKTARVIAASRRRKANLISWFHLCWRAFADICCAKRQDAMSAAHCRVRVTAGCDRPSAVPNQGTIHDALSPEVWELSSVVWGFAIKWQLALRLLGLVPIWIVFL